MDLSKQRDFLLSEIKINNPRFYQKLIHDLINIIIEDGKPRHNRFYSELIQNYFPFNYNDPNKKNIKDTDYDIFSVKSHED